MTKLSQLQTPRSRELHLHRILALVLTLCVFTLVLETFSLLDTAQDGGSLLQRAITTGITWHQLQYVPGTSNPNEVSSEDLLHLSLLHENCVSNANATLPWVFGSPGYQLANGTASNPEAVIHQDDTDLLQKLRQCPDVDIFLPAGLHGNGYCEDAVAYAKYLKSRLLPAWALEAKHFDPELGQEVDYFDLCPRTPVIFFNHYWDGVPSSPRWPKDKPIYLMPNIEMMELTSEHYWNVDAVLCKTNECYDRVTKWYEQEGNPRNASVFYTKHTSSDQAQFARTRLGEDAIAPKNFSDIKFIHTAGTSAWKGTREVMQCWIFNAGLPPLDVYIDDKPFDRLFGPNIENFVKHSRSPVTVHVGLLERSEFTKLTAEAAFFICPSYSEGYGHYINQARASGAVIVTTDVSPMNELITNETGLLIPVKRQKHPFVMLGGAYRGQHGLKGVDGLMATFEGPDICEAVRILMNSTTTEERAAMGAKVRKSYHEHTLFFANAMKELRKFAKIQQQRAGPP